MRNPEQQSNQEDFWTKEERRYNRQINFVEWSYDFHPEAFRVLDNKTLNAVFLYFGVDKYYSDENFLKRRKKIIEEDPDLEKVAIYAMRKVAKQLGVDKNGEIFGS